MYLTTLGRLALAGLSFKRDKPLLLLCYLALEPADHGHAREAIADMVWHEAASASRRRQSLNDALSKLNKLSSGLVEKDAERILRANVRADVHDLLAVCKGHDVARVLSLYKGPFLHGIELRLELSEELAEWVRHKRDYLTGQVWKVWLREAEKRAGEACYDEAVRVLEEGYARAQAFPPEESDLKRLFCLLRAGESPLAGAVQREAAELGLRLLLSADEARTRLGSGLFVGVPAVPALFIGRGGLLAALRQRLLTSPGPVAIEGLPGVGKTTLAGALAHDVVVRHYFKDGVLWAGLGVDGDIGGALTRWGEALAVDMTGLKTDSERADAIKSVLDRKHVLLVIDDVWQEDKTLLACAGPNCRVLVTTRDRGVAEALAATVDHIPALSDEDSLLMLKALAPEACDDRPEEARELLDVAGGLPLALELLGSYLAVHGGQFSGESRKSFKLDAARRLALTTTRSGDFRDGAPSLQQVIELSFSGLPERALRAFYALGAFLPKPERFSLAAAQAVSEVDADTLEIFARRNLIEMRSGGWLSLHQALSDAARAYTPPEAVRRYCRYYLELAQRATDQELTEAYGQFRAVLYAAPVDEALVRAAHALGGYQERRGLWAERGRWLERGLKAAEALEHSGDAAKMCYHLGRTHYHLEHLDKATCYFEQSLKLFKALGDAYQKEQADTLHWLALTERSKGASPKQCLYYAQALALFRKLGDRRGVAQTLHNLAHAERFRGNPERAQDLFEESLRLYHEEVDDEEELAWLLCNFGHFIASQDNLSEAQRYLEKSLHLFQKLDHREGRAWSLHTLASILHKQGELALAFGHAQAALYLFNMPPKGNIGVAWSNFVLGEIEFSKGDYKQAREHFLSYVTTMYALGDLSAVACGLEKLGQLAETEMGFVPAAYLFGAAKGLHEEGGKLVLSPAESVKVQRSLAKVRESLHHSTFSKAWREGQTASLEEVVSRLTGTGLLTEGEHAAPKHYAGRRPS